MPIAVKPNLSIFGCVTCICMDNVMAQIRPILVLSSQFLHSLFIWMRVTTTSPLGIFSPTGAFGTLLCLFVETPLFGHLSNMFLVSGNSNT